MVKNERPNKETKKQKQELKTDIQPSMISVLHKCFSIDIRNLARYMDNATDTGRGYKEAVVATNNDLDLFISAHIRQYTDGKFNVEFWADRVEITAPLVEFISTCVKKFGPTLTGTAEVTPEDYVLAEQGMFDRMWNEVCVSISNNDQNQTVMMLTLFNPAQAKSVAIDKEVITPSNNRIKI